MMSRISFSGTGAKNTAKHSPFPSPESEKNILGLTERRKYDITT